MTTTHAADDDYDQGAHDAVVDATADETANQVDQGAPDGAADQGAPIEAEAQTAHYNLRPRRNDVQSTFQQAINAPHDGKSYFPPR
jgi:hypothetical protein